MRQFLQHHGEQILGVLSGFDRLRLRGTLRIFASEGGVVSWLQQAGIALKDFLTWITGFRNREVREALYGTTEDDCERRRQAARVTRKFAMLRAHGRIKKISHTHRYVMTSEGVTAITALLAARRVPLTRLTAA